ncbi:15936_t:CDS:2, partial [Entrophospora sp. SA101]
MSQKTMKTIANNDNKNINEEVIENNNNSINEEDDGDEKDKKKITMINSLLPSSSGTSVKSSKKNNSLNYPTPVTNSNSNIRTINGGIEQVRGENNKLFDENEKLSEENNKFANDVEQLRAERNKLDNDKCSLLVDICQMEHRLACEELRVNELEEELTDVRRQYSLLNVEHEELDRDRTQYREQCNLLNIEREELDRDRARYRGELELANVKVAEQEELISKQKYIVEGLTTSLEDKEETNKKLQKIIDEKDEAMMRMAEGNAAKDNDKKANSKNENNNKKNTEEKKKKDVKKDVVKKNEKKNDKRNEKKNEKKEEKKKLDDKKEADKKGDKKGEDCGNARGGKGGWKMSVKKTERKVETLEKKKINTTDFRFIHERGRNKGRGSEEGEEGMRDHGPDSIIKSLENQADLFFNNNNEGDNDSINTLDLTKEVKIEQDNQVTCGPARIRKLQILSHHYKIASKLEIYVGTVQRRKEVVGGMTNNINNNDNPADVKRTISWDKMPKIIENDGMCSDDESGEDVQDDDFVIATATNHNDTNYDLIKMNGEPYIHFKRLGYCALDSNERANYKAREFKSVRLDVDGEYIRLVARKCYTNHLNQYNQVGIVGITVMGEPANYLLVGESTKIPIENADDGLSRVASPEVCIVPIIQERCHQPHDQRNFGSLYSLLQGNNNDIRESLNPSTSKQPEISTVKRKLKDYLTANDFLQNQNETARLLLAFDNAKKNAVKVEDFPLAKVLKYSVELMKRGVEEVAKLDVLKHEAVVVEDFDNADKYKREIEAVRDEIRTALSDEGLDIDDQDEVMVYDPQLDPQLQDIIGLADDNSYNENNNNISPDQYNNNN